MGIGSRFFHVADIAKRAENLQKDRGQTLYDLINEMRMYCKNPETLLGFALHFMGMESKIKPNLEGCEGCHYLEEERIREITYDPVKTIEYFPPTVQLCSIGVEIIRLVKKKT